MAKTKIDDLPKGTEEMDAEEQKAAKGGLRATLSAQTLAARSTLSATSQTLAKPTLEDPSTLDAATLETKIEP